MSFKQDQYNLVLKCNYMVLLKLQRKFLCSNALKLYAFSLFDHPQYWRNRLRRGDTTEECLDDQNDRCVGVQREPEDPTLYICSIANPGLEDFYTSFPEASVPRRRDM